MHCARRTGSGALPLSFLKFLYHFEWQCELPERFVHIAVILIISGTIREYFLL